jgi:hypothetical protein
MQEFLLPDMKRILSKMKIIFQNGSPLFGHREKINVTEILKTNMGASCTG